MRAKIVFAGVQCRSFAEARTALVKLAGLDVLSKRVWRTVCRVGEQRAEERDRATRAFAALPLPAQRQAPPDAIVPEIACVSMDGGRYQHRTRRPAEAEESDAGWREMKVGCLISMTGDVAAEDPCPQLPATFADPERIAKITREIKRLSAAGGDDEPGDASGENFPRDDSPDVLGADLVAREPRPGRPLVVYRSVTATARDVTAFGPQLAAAAYDRGFHAASRKAFVADGSETNWGVWRKFFSAYTPIVDFMHALTYVYAAAVAGDASARGRERYRAWAQLLWSGATDQLLAALEERQQTLGVSTSDERAAPRMQLAESLRYLSNQRERLHYDRYRRAGLPITSTYVESTIKQLNRRVKGTEKFWAEGIEPILILAADHLSQPPAPLPARPLATEPLGRQAA